MKSKIKKILSTAGVLSVALLSGVVLTSCDDEGSETSDVDLSVKKAEAITSVSTYKDKGNYKEAQKTEIETIISEATTKINSSTSVDVINSAVSEAKTKLDAVKTSAQIDAENVHTHVYGNWSVTTAPTETKAGLISRTCSTDNNVETAELPVLTDTSYSENKLESITFKDSTFNGIIQQCARVYTKELVFDGCTFNNYINSASPSDSNPIWIQTPYSLNFTMNDCTVNSSRPIKIVEGTVTGNYTFTNNTFDVSFENTGDEDGEFKHMAIAFESSTALGNVLVSGNTLKAGTALIAFRTNEKQAPYTAKINMKDGATFTVINNTICDGANLSSPWKINEAWMPDFVITTAETEE